MSVASRSTILNDAIRGCRIGFVSLAVFSFFINLLILTTPLFVYLFVRGLMV